MGDAGTLSVAAQDTLTGAGVQTVTGAKTFNDQKLIQKNPAGTFNLTNIHPAITSNKYRRPYQDFDYLIYKEGSTYYAVNGLEQAVDYEGSSLDTVLGSVMTAIGSRKPTIVFGRGDFVFTTTWTFSSSIQYLTILGQGFATRFLSTTDIPVMYLDGCRYVTVSNLAFANDSLTTKTSSFVDLGDATQFCTFDHVQMMQNNTTSTTQKGTGVRIVCDGAGATYFNLFNDVTYRGLNDCNVVDTTASTTASVWVNGNNWVNCKAFYFLTFMKVSQKGGGSSVEGHFDANGFTALELQCNPTGAEATVTVFDFEGVAGDGLVTCRFSDIIVWDKPAAANALKVTPRTTLFTGPNQNLTGSIAGTGSTTGGVKITPTTTDSYLDIFASAAPANPITTIVRQYATVINAFNVGYYFKTKVNGNTVVVKL